jgi:hypothetical protein
VTGPADEDEKDRELDHVEPAPTLEQLIEALTLIEVAIREAGMEVKTGLLALARALHDWDGEIE